MKFQIILVIYANVLPVLRSERRCRKDDFKVQVPCETENGISCSKAFRYDEVCSGLPSKCGK